MERFNPVPSLTEYLQQANDSLVTIVQIETKEALEAVDDIAAVDGIDVLFIGPFDLGEGSSIHPLPVPTPRASDLPQQDANVPVPIQAITSAIPFLTAS